MLFSLTAFGIMCYKCRDLTASCASAGQYGEKVNCTTGQCVKWALPLNKALRDCESQASETIAKVLSVNKCNDKAQWSYL